MMLVAELIAAALFGAAACGAVLNRLEARAREALDRIEAQQNADAEQQAADALLDAIIATLEDRPLEWKARVGVLAHHSGLEIRSDGDELTIWKGATCVRIVGERRDRLLRACQARNGRELLSGLAQERTA